MPYLILETVTQKLANNIIIVKVNVELAQQFSIEEIPTLLLFKDGKIMKRFTGVQSEHILLNALQEVTGAVPVNNADIFA